MEKTKIIELIPTITKQNDIEEVLTYTARVEKYQNDAWSETTELNETQLSQLQWYFIKNNDENDKDIITDNPTNDTITINGLTMTVNIQEDNIYKWRHTHCFVRNSETEGYAHTYLQRYLEVTDIVPIHTSQEDGQCTARFNVDEIRPEELVKVRWTVEGREESKYNGKEQITHNLKDEEVHEINFTAYFEGKPQEGANVRLTYDERAKILTSLGFEDDN